MIPLLTAEEFIEGRYELPEAGQWSELEAGVVKSLQPPDVDHGNVIRNLSLAFAHYVQRGGPGYSCFDLGLALARRPDTVRFPAACYFLSGPRFAESDQAFTEARPSLVIELASTNDRRRGMTDRVLGYHEVGVGEVWVIDPQDQSVHRCPRAQKTSQLTAEMTLRGEPILPGFVIPVRQLFAEPEWWK